MAATEQNTPWDPQLGQNQRGEGGHKKERTGHKKERTGQQEDESEICTSAHNKIQTVLLAAPGKALL